MPVLTRNMLTEGATTKNGLLTLGTGEQFTNATTSYVPATLKYYEEPALVQATLTFTNTAAEDDTVVDVYYMRTGRMVLFNTDIIEASGDAGGDPGIFITAAGAIPARFRPAVQQALTV